MRDQVPTRLWAFRRNPRPSSAPNHDPGEEIGFDLLQHRRLLAAPNTPLPPTMPEQVEVEASRWSGSSSSMPWWRGEARGAVARYLGRREEVLVEGSNPAIPPADGPRPAPRLNLLPGNLKTRRGKDLPSR